MHIHARPSGLLPFREVKRSGYISTWPFEPGFPSPLDLARETVNRIRSFTGERAGQPLTR